MTAGTLLLLVGGTGCGNSSFNENSTDSVSSISSNNNQPAPIVRANSQPTTDLEISWAAPATREDGSALSLSEIGGYEIEVVNLDTSQRNSYTVHGSHQSSYVIQNLQPGSYRFFLFSFDTDNRISEPAILSHIIQESASTG